MSPSAHCAGRLDRRGLPLNKWGANFAGFVEKSFSHESGDQRSRSCGLCAAHFPPRKASVAGNEFLCYYGSFDLSGMLFMIR